MSENISFNPNTITHEDFVALKDKWRARLVGSKQINDLSNKYIEKKISEVNNMGQNSWNIMNKEDDAAVLFGVTPVTTSADMGDQFKHMYNMTLAYGTWGTKLYHDRHLEQDILYALEWLRDNLYGPDEMEGHGWRDVFAFNWWDWYINVPMKLLPSLLILENEIGGEMIQRHTEMWEYVRTHMRQAKNLAEAQSRVQVVTMSAALREDSDLMLECMDDFERILRPTISGEGVYDDFTYLNHGVYPLVGTYGAACLCDRLITTASVLAGTKFEVNSVYKYNQALWIYNTFDPQMYRGNVMAWGNGREPGTGDESGRMVIISAVDLIGVFSNDDDKRLKEFIHRHVDGRNMKKVISQMSVAQIADLVRVMDEKIEVPEQNYAHVYYHGDAVVWHRSDYAVGIHMHSHRIGNYECINDVNKTGWYQGDGAVLLYNAADSDDPFGDDFWNYSNPYHIPGTTEDVQPRLASSYRVPYLSSPTFVGGAEMDKQYVTAVMDFEAFHNEKAPQTADDGYGGDFDLHNNDLKAKKSWFMFDDEVVALGAGINSTTGFEVQTTVENHAMSGVVAPKNNLHAVDVSVEYETSAVGDGEPIYGVEKITIDGNVLPNTVDGINQTFENASWANLEGYAGYYFPQGGKLTAYKENKSYPYLELFLCHGKNPNNAAYAYTLLPNRTAEETAAYAANPDITVLSNTVAIQAVREKNTNLTGMVFWQAGSFNGFTASIPMVVMVKEMAEGIQIAVSDPSMSHGSKIVDNLQVTDCNNGMSIENETVTLTVNRPLTLVSADSGIRAESKADAIVLEIDFGLSGRTLNANLR